MVGLLVRSLLPKAIVFLRSLVTRRDIVVIGTTTAVDMLGRHPKTADLWQHCRRTARKEKKTMV